MKTYNCIDNCWAVCHNGNDVWHLTEGYAGSKIHTGQPNLDVFSSFELAIEAIPEQYRPQGNI